MELIQSAPSPLRFPTSRLALWRARKPDRLQGALLISEAQPRSWGVCALALVNDASVWFSATEDPGREDTRCAIDEAATADGDLLQTEVQHSRIQVYCNTRPDCTRSLVLSRGMVNAQ